MPYPALYLYKVKSLFILSAMLLCLSSCEKMAMKHTCNCTLIRIMNGKQEEVGQEQKGQIGSYEAAQDTCHNMLDAYNYTKNTTDGTEIHSAICEID